MSVDYDIIVHGNNLSFDGGYFGLANVTLVLCRDGPILFDTGHYCNQPALLAGLNRHGMTPDDVKAVFLSHLHYDHCNNIHLFENARVLVSEREWDYAADPHPDDLMIPWLVREQLQTHDLELISGEHRLGEGLRYLPAPGHTPGSFALVLETETKGRVVLAGDAIKYAKEVINRRSDMAFDTEAHGTETIERLLHIADRIVPGHFPELVRHGDDFVWDEPAEITLRIR